MNFDLKIFGIKVVSKIFYQLDSKFCWIVGKNQVETLHVLLAYQFILQIALSYSMEKVFRFEIINRALLGRATEKPNHGTGS